jgi:MFS family permease
MMTGGALGTFIWLPTILSLMAQKSGAADATAAVPFVSHGIMLWSLGGICGGYIAFGFICDTIGRRATVMLYSVGKIVFGLILYLALPGYEPWYPRILSIFGFFVFGVFSGYAVYLPELFPTHIAQPPSGSAPAVPVLSRASACSSPGSWWGRLAAASTAFQHS